VSLLDRVRAYYAACNTGDAQAIAAFFTPDATHFFTRLPPVRGAQAIGEQTAAAVAAAGAEWHVEHGIEQGDEVAIEFANTWSDPRDGERRTIRGSEWLTFDADGRITEVRAYYFRDGLLRDP
jgi:ketosteroid isomerase-like protein